MSIRIHLLFSAVWLLLFAVTQSSADIAFAQAGAPPCEWSAPINLSQTPATDSRPGAIIGDPYGQVHAFWGEEFTSDALGRANYVAYRHWDGVEWSPASEVLVSPKDGWLSVDQVALGRDATWLYMVWQNNLGTNFSAVPLLEATDARAWQTKRLADGPPERPAIAVDVQDQVHVLYVDNHRALNHVTSSDGGVSWSNPVQVWNVEADNRAISTPYLIANHAGVIHAVWAVNAEEIQWQASGIRYSRSSDGGQTWTSPLAFEEYRGGNPALFEAGDNVLHLFWNGPAGTVRGRFYSWSEDGGNTWAPMKWLDGYTGGMSGTPTLVADSTGRVIVMDAAGLASDTSRPVAIAAYLYDRDWGAPAAVPGPSGDWPAFTITGGNQLHALLWTQTQPAEMLYSTCALRAPLVTPAPMPTGQPVVSPTRNAAVAPAAAASQSTAMPTQATHPAAGSMTVQPTSKNTSSGMSAVLVGALPSGVLVLLVSGYVLMHSRRRR